MASSDKNFRNSNQKKVSSRKKILRRAKRKIEEKSKPLEQWEKLRKAADCRHPNLDSIADCGLDPCPDCGRDGCPKCLHRFRHNLLDGAYRLKLDTAVWTRVSIIPRDALVERLADFDLDAFRKRMLKCLERSPLRDTLVLGGVDISRNLFENRIVGWQPHVYALINDFNTPKLNKAVREAFPPSSDAFVPFHLTQIGDHDLFTCLSYAYKAVFWRRSGYWGTRQDGAVRRNTDDLYLRRDEFIELFDWLAQHPVGARLVMRGLRRQSPPGAPELKLARKLPMVKRSGAVVEVPEKKG